MVNKYRMFSFSNGEIYLVEADSEAQGDIENLEGVEIRNDLFLSPKYRVSKKNNVPSINETVDEMEYIKLQINAPEDGDYQINWYLEWSLNSTSNDFKCKIKKDSDILAELVQEPKDAAGISNIIGSNLDSKTDQRLPYSGETEITLNKGVHNVGIYFTSDKKNKTATIYRAYIKCERVA